MKKRIIPITLIAMCLLSSCSQTPDNIQGNNHNVDLNSENNKVSVEHILDDFDKAFETKYTKFSLPEKSQVIINQPEEVCDLELKYVNADKSMDWLKERVYKLADIFNVQNYGDLKNVGNVGYVLENNKERVRADVFSEPYYCSNDAAFIDEMNFVKIKHLDRIKYDNIDEKYKMLIDQSVNCANKINDIFGGSFTDNPMDLYIRDHNGEKYYELSLQPTYKGVGLQCITPTYSNGDIFEGNNALMTMGLDIRFLYDSDFNLDYYVSCDNYTPIKSDPIDKIISFKGACDILEEELASNVSMEFDDVKLWYEPRGTILDATTEDGFDGSKTTKCTPKWFFISDSADESDHTINYVTVDCVTGEIEVFFPG